MPAQVPAYRRKVTAVAVTVAQLKVLGGYNIFAGCTVTSVDDRARVSTTCG